MDIKEEIFLNAISSHLDLLDEFKKNNFTVIQKIIDRITTCFEKEGKLLLVGNGGSAADCQHIAGELVGRFKMNRRPLAALSLTNDTSVLTCIANDYDYESVFSRQLEALAKPQDILWALSTSGSSANVVKAAQLAKEKDLIVIAFTGKDNSLLEKISDICLCAGTAETAHAQEIHQIAYHIICNYLDDIYTD